MKKSIVLILMIVAISFFVFQIINNFWNTENNINGNSTEEENTNSGIENNTIEDEGKDNPMPSEDIIIKISINGNVFTATLENNEATEELLQMLPLNITMNDLNGNEKYYYLDRSLTTNSINPKKIELGDIMIFGNNYLVIFYESHATSYSYTRLGKIDDPSNLKSILGSGNVDVRIEK